MDDRKKKKIWRRVLILTEDPDIAELARQHFCSSKPEAPQMQRGELQTKPERTNRVFDLFALGCAWAGWFYSVVNPEASFFWGSALLLGAIGFLWAALFTFVGWKSRGKVISVLFAIVLFAGVDFAWYRHKLKVASLNVEVAKAAELKEAFQLLTGQIDYDGDDAILSVFEYSNGSSSKMLIDRMEFIAREISFVKSGTISFDRMHFAKDMHGLRLEPGGDGLPDQFFAELFSNAGIIGHRDQKGRELPLSCADITIRISYRLESQSMSEQHKTFRAATKPTRSGLRWVKVNVDAPSNFCADTYLQREQ
jgi:hypothetical protein